MTRERKRRGSQPLRKSGNLTFRLRGTLRDDLEKAAAAAGRSLSEEIESRLTRDFAWEATRSDIGTLHKEAAAQVSAARIQALRAAGLMILRETTGMPTRVIVDLQTLLSEAEEIVRGFRSGFVPQDSSLPPIEPTRPMTDEEAQRLVQEIRRTIEDAMGKTRAADAAAAAEGKSDDEAA